MIIRQATLGNGWDTSNELGFIICSVNFCTQFMHMGMNGNSGRIVTNREFILDPYRVDMLDFYYNGEL